MTTDQMRDFLRTPGWAVVSRYLSAQAEQANQSLHSCDPNDSVLVAKLQMRYHSMNELTTEKGLTALINSLKDPK